MIHKLLESDLFVTVTVHDSNELLQVEAFAPNVVEELSLDSKEHANLLGCSLEDIDSELVLSAILLHDGLSVEQLLTKLVLIKELDYFILSDRSVFIHEPAKDGLGLRERCEGEVRSTLKDEVVDHGIDVLLDEVL